MSTFLAVLLVGVGSYLFRALPLLRAGARDVSARANHILDNGAIAAIVALVAEDIISSPTASTRTAMLVALALAGVLAVKGRSMAVLISVGMIAYTLLTHIL